MATDNGRLERWAMRSTTPWKSVYVVCVLLGGPVAPDSRQLRPVSPFEAGVIREGLCKSPTLQALADRLDASDLTVYVSVKPLRDRRLAGGLRFLAATPTDRVLLIEIAFGLDRYARIAMLGHELEHAVEVAETVEIRDKEGFRLFYASHGAVSAIEGAYETDAARQAEVFVRKDLAQASLHRC
jgi:hypothetical protein